MEEQVTELTRRIEELEHYIGFEKERQRKKVQQNLEHAQKELAKWTRVLAAVELKKQMTVAIGAGMNYRLTSPESARRQVQLYEKQVAKFTELLSNYQ